MSTLHAASILLTPDQEKAENLALELRNDPIIKTAREASIKRYEASRMGLSADGKATIPGAVDEMVYGILLSVTDDPANPKLIWFCNLPYTIGKRSLPGSCYAGDNPDRIYRSIAVNTAYRYEIRGRCNKDKPALYLNIEAIMKGGIWALPSLAFISSKDVDFANDGSFVISVDATPTNGRRNHLQMPPGTDLLFIRDSIPDWKNQLPNEYTVKRVDGGPTPTRSREDIIMHAAEEIDRSVTMSLDFCNGVWLRPANQLDVYVRPLAWGVVAVNRFSLKDDDAMVITLDPLDSVHLNIQAMDNYLRSTPYSNRTTNLNLTQVKPNADGTITFVLSLKDPGIYNWVDTGGLHDGVIGVRWDLSKPAGPDVAGKAMREVRMLKLSQLAATLPVEVVRVSPAERQQQQAERQAAFEVCRPK